MAENLPIIDETIIIKNKTINIVFQECEKWLQKRTGMLNNEYFREIECLRPNRLVVSHYKQGAEGMSSGENKKITINLSTIEENVKLQIIMEHFDPDTLLDTKLTAVYWGYLVTSLLNHFNIIPDSKLLKRLYPKEKLSLDLTILFPTIIGILSIIIFIYLMINYKHEYDVLLFITGFYGIYFSILCLPWLFRFYRIKQELY